MNKYQEPHYSDPQLLWDIDDAITCLMAAAKQIRAGQPVTKHLEYAVLSIRSAQAAIEADRELESVMTIGAEA